MISHGKGQANRISHHSTQLHVSGALSEVSDLKSLGLFSSPLASVSMEECLQQAWCAKNTES